MIAGTLAGHEPPAPPPSSWASRPEADVALWHVVLDPGASWTMPTAAFDDSVRVLYVFEGDRLTIHNPAGEGETVGTTTGVVVDARAGGHAHRDRNDTEVLVLQGRPIGEPVAQQARS